MLRLRGAGCAGSKQEPSPRLDPAPALPKKKPSILVAEPELVKLAHSDDFATQFSPLFTEYLSLLREVDPALKPDPVTNITPKDALLVIDMQADFVPKSHTNKTGGRFGVPEGDHIVPSCTDLIRHVRRARSHSRSACCPRGHITAELLTSRRARALARCAVFPVRRESGGDARLPSD
jgi:hypothetical protein